MSKPRTQFEALRQLLDAQAATLSGETASRLNRARQAALDGLAEPRRRRLLWAWPALASAALVAAVAVPLLRQPEPALAVIDLDELTAVVEERALLGSNEPLEMVDDMEFYAWLSSQSSEG